MFVAFKCGFCIHCVCLFDMRIPVHVSVPRAFSLRFLVNFLFCYSFKPLYWSCLTANQWFMPSWGSPSWETAMDSWHCLFSMHLMMGIKYGNSRNCPTPAGATHDAYPIICLHSLMRLALPVNTVTRECGSLTRPKQPCVFPMVAADVTKGRTEIFKFDTQRIICCRAVPYTTCLVLLAEDFGCPYLLLFLVNVIPVCLISSWPESNHCQYTASISFFMVQLPLHSNMWQHWFDPGPVVAHCGMLPSSISFRISTFSLYSGVPL